jgi:uncharacterized protein
MKRCMVVYATPTRQWSWQVELPDPATVGDALNAARAEAGDVSVPWDADVGIFGEPCDRAALPRDGDRVEIYRPLNQDPKESRRARAAAARAARDPAAARPRASSGPKSTR